MTDRLIRQALELLTQVDGADDVVRDLVALASSELETALGYLKCMADPITVDFMAGRIPLSEAVQARAAQYGITPLPAEQADRLAELLDNADPDESLVVPAVADVLTEAEAAAALAVCPFPDGASPSRAHCRHAAGADGCCWCGSVASSATPTCRYFDVPPCPGFADGPGPEMPY